MRGSRAVAATSLLLGLLAISGRDLPTPDEPRVAGIAREMAIEREFLLPRLNGTPFLEYPSLGYVPQAILFWVTGRATPFLALLPSALFAAGTVCLTIRLGKLLGGERLGLTAGFFLATTVGFFGLHRLCLVDPSLLFFITLSLLGFLEAYTSEERRALPAVLFYAGMAGGVLSKGLIGAAVPATTAIAFLTAKRDLRGLRKLRWPLAIPALLLPLLAWGGALCFFHGKDALFDMIAQSLWRLGSPEASHANPSPLYYFAPCALHLLPWSCTLAAVPWLLRRGRKPPGGAGGLSTSPALFPLVGFAVVFVGLSAASAKRYLYIAPLYPPTALLAATLWIEVRNVWERVRRYERAAAAAILAAYAMVHFSVLVPIESKDTLRPIFELARERARGQSVYLHRPSEVLRGAAVFYLGTTVPVLAGPEDLPRPPPGSEPAILLTRRKKEAADPFEADASGSLRFLKEWPEGSRTVVRAYEASSVPRGAGDPAPVAR